MSTNCLTTPTIICATLTKPPTFKPDHYEQYRNDMAWWVQMQAGISHDRLLASVGVHEDGVVNGF